MKFTAMFAFAVLLAALSSHVQGKAHLEQVFEVDMPMSATGWSGEIGYINSVLADDMMYVVATGQDTVEAVNLTTKKNAWQAINISMAYTIQLGYIAATKSVVLLQYADGLKALDAKTGAKLWTSNAGYVMYGYPPYVQATAYEMNDVVYVYCNTPMDYTAIVGFHRHTGAVVSTDYVQSVFVDKENHVAYLNRFSYNPSTGAFSYADFVAKDLKTGANKWTAGPVVKPQGGVISPVVAVHKGMLLLGNYSGNDEVGFLLNADTGAVQYQFEAFNGLATQAVNSPPRFLNGKLFVLVGVDYPRYLLIDLSTGYIIWTRSYLEIGAAVSTGDALISISTALTLTIASIGGSAAPIQIPQVPSLPTATLIDFGEGAVMVGNLQGYTLWDATDGTFIGRNEMSPGVATAPFKWNGVYVSVSGNKVIGSRLVR